MRHRIVVVLAIIALFCSGLSGCVTVSEEHKGAAKGAGLGAVAGALAGAVLSPEGSTMKGAVLGGLAGALIGGLVGNYTIDQKQTAQQTAERYKFQPATGTTMVRMEALSVTPAVMKQGGKVEIQSTYALLTPSGTDSVAVTESVEIRLNGELVGNPEAMVTHGGGTYTFTIPIMLPADAKKGTYKVLVSVRTATGKDSREGTFTIQ